MNQETRDRIAAACVYDDLTATTEKTIRRMMEHGDRAGAFGAWMLWHDMTVGYQNDGDSERLSIILWPAEAA